MPLQHRHFLTVERRLQLLEKIRARHEARISVGLPPDEVDSEEEDKEAAEDVRDAWHVDMHAILDSIRSELDAEARHRHRQEMEAKQTMKKAEMFSYLDEIE
ncbi:Disease resistance protein RPM1 [Hordeum vulgare]|nr:Disease resistance protein RPM1 [Hordeum vulgare]KAE8787593.1 Disease resistance protein RPM1 [Hordeum vulgare]